MSSGELKKLEEEFPRHRRANKVKLKSLEVTIARVYPLSIS